ncbi:hypothetical protein Cgig2_013917 [Carnegiea gigantea]|uniref:Uncharacterized protein n=1 Tax=Carnegiea gigantea TaxID=171969 RepID=A0A9Q1JM01_9CARY|nr:hypothetical protein Cgig2_013917 [Carnegiea gigantea]
MGSPLLKIFRLINQMSLGTPSQPLGIQATGADFFSTYGRYKPLNPELLSMIYAGNQQQLPTLPPQPQNVDIENAREEHTDTSQNKGEEPTDIVLFSDTHQSRDPKTKGKWVDGKSQRKVASPYMFLSKGKQVQHVSYENCGLLMKSLMTSAIYHFDITSMYISFGLISLGLVVIQVT